MGAFLSISSQRESGFFANALSVLCSVLLTAIALFAYGQHRSQKFQALAPWTNMTGVQQAVGKPTYIKTNVDGTVLWDYTKFWCGTARVYFVTNGYYVRTFTE
jgi:hypothetical protein